ncbi:MAG: hypothetical protein ABFC57_06255 [Veillonellales bacterium]
MENPYETLTLEQLIEHSKPGPDLSSGASTFAARIHKELVKLKELQDSAIRAADKYLNNTPQDQFIKIVSENREESEAYVKLTTKPADQILKKEYAMELIDGQMVRHTALRVLGYSENEILQLRKEVIEKNKIRNYYEVKKNEKYK